MKNLRTENCIICGDKSEGCSGHVIARQKMALGNYIIVHIGAGFCSDCGDRVLSNEIKSDENGCYGLYDPDKMGKFIPMFNK